MDAFDEAMEHMQALVEMLREQYPGVVGRVHVERGIMADVAPRRFAYDSGRCPKGQVGSGGMKCVPGYGGNGHTCVRDCRKNTHIYDPWTGKKL